MDGTLYIVTMGVCRLDSTVTMGDCRLDSTIIIVVVDWIQL